MYYKHYTQWAIEKDIPDELYFPLIQLSLMIEECGSIYCGEQKPEDYLVTSTQSCFSNSGQNLNLLKALDKADCLSYETKEDGYMDNKITLLS